MNLLTVLAHEGEEVVGQTSPALDTIIRTNSLNFSMLAMGLLLLLVVISLIIKVKNDLVKGAIFGLISLVVIINSIYLVSSTIYLNKQSITGGPVHWHADYRIFKCGQELELKDPEGLANKVGTEVVHEHNDNRIHLEGVLLDIHDASLSHFFNSVGGKMTNHQLAIPTQKGPETLATGQSCPNGPAALQVFVYQTRGDTFIQKKLTDPVNYQISPEGNIPPGDCVIIELDRPKEQTDKLCQQYQAKEKLKEIHRGN